MDILKNKTFGIAAALVLLMAATRYNHFGSAMALPDASYAVFFLGGLFLGRARGALAVLALLLVEALCSNPSGLETTRCRRFPALAQRD
jgi:hypothetical protein